jgi:hypothetical protein
MVIETVICICGALLLGGIAKVCSIRATYSEEYYRYLRYNNKIPKVPEIDMYRYV